MDKTKKVSSKEIYDVACDILREHPSREEIVEMIVAAGFDAWGITGPKEKFRTQVSKIVGDAVKSQKAAI
ncbi:MAG: hypothetical protein H6625_06770 [Bdellovibrionaceae bacterium]|nr:hypothetical protein [Pseudobdellovibrionaceae bacterium]MCB9093225.1 hypothetical protein [Halobacteriovoraceae bacterium]